MISTIASVLSPLATVQSAPLNPTIKPYESLFNPTLFLYGYNDSQYGSDHMENEPGLDYDNFTLDEFFRTLDQDNFTNGTNSTDNTDHPQIPAYIRTTSMVFCIIIMCLGVVGNVMVPIVIMKTKDMRNSTNIFLMNLSIADLMVLLVCTPTVLVEVNTKPETWVLGKEMCLAVPFVELTVAHASVLTILAISFERYYAICEPLKAGYVCTKTRAALICFMAWFVAAVFTSPILAVAKYRIMEYHDGSRVPVCLTQANNFWSTFYFLMTISVFFLIPFLILLVLYTIIAKNLISTASKVVMNKHVDCYNFRARKQVVMMLGTVILSFFICLMPFKFLTLWIIIVSDETVSRLGVEKYYNILYFSRTMLYLNSAVNPILYNLMSSKFRDGFLLVCRLKNKHQLKNFRRGYRERAGTFHTTSTSYTNSSSSSRRSNSLKHMVFKKSSFDGKSTIVSRFNDEQIDTAQDVREQDTKRELLLSKRAKLDRSISLFPNLFSYKAASKQQINSLESNDSVAKPCNWRIYGKSEDDILEEKLPIEARFEGSNRKEKLPFLNKQRSLDSGCHSGGYSLRKSVVLRSAKSKSLESDDRDVNNASQESYV